MGNSQITEGPFRLSPTGGTAKTTVTPKGEAITFAVDNVEVCKVILPSLEAEENLKRLIRGKIESHYEPKGGVIDYGDYYEGNSLNGFVAAADFAYRKHYPLVLTPDLIWLAIIQGFAKHVNENAEKLRKAFVAHEGKALIEVRRDDFIKGNPKNPWPEMFDKFADQIRKHIGDINMNLIMPDFSTTGDLEKAVASVTLMDSMQSYFRYEVFTCCGIPNVSLKGRVEDWENLKAKTKELEKFDAEFWIGRLIPILDEFIQAAKGKPNKKFWKNLYKLNGGSGGPYINGWILNFFPYLEKNGSVRRNQCLDNWKKTPGWLDGITTDMFPSGLSSAPFLWRYYDEKFKMRFVSGFIGVQQDPNTRALSPQIGWAIVDEEHFLNNLMKMM